MQRWEKTGGEMQFGLKALGTIDEYRHSPKLLTQIRDYIQMIDLGGTQQIF